MVYEWCPYFWCPRHQRWLGNPLYQSLTLPAGSDSCYLYIIVHLGGSTVMGVPLYRWMV